MDYWTVLNSEISDPTVTDLKGALTQLFEHGDTEHPDAWVSCGSNEGSLHTLTIFHSGRAEYIEYSDADMIDELQKKDLGIVTKEIALTLWTDFIAKHGRG